MLRARHEGGETMSVEVDIRVPVGLPLRETAEFIARCEAAGFSGVGVHDHQHSGRDVYVTLALAAERTSSLVLYPATSNPVTRHPMVLASLAHSLEEIASGRVRLTLGPGFLSVGSISRPRASVETMRQAIVTIRRLLAGETVSFDGTESRLRHVGRPPTPVYMTAAGPRMVELAGEVADGALLLVGLDARSIAAARERLLAGARRAGRDLTNFPVTFITPMTLSDDSREARQWPKRWFRPGQPWLLYPSKANLFWLREAGLDLPEEFKPEQLSDDLAARISDAFGLFGTAEECAERLLRAAREAAVGRVFIFPSHTQETGYEMPRREVEAFRRVIFPRLGR